MPALASRWGIALASWLPRRLAFLLLPPLLLDLLQHSACAGNLSAQVVRSGGQIRHRRRNAAAYAAAAAAASGSGGCRIFYPR